MDVNHAYSYAVARRTYNRPHDMANPTTFETWEETVDRVIDHQKWLWERAISKPLNPRQKYELNDLRHTLLDHRGILAGRTMWLGGTPKSREVECSQFNCAYTSLQTVRDAVDIFWLLLNGCGVGFKPQPGNLFGFATHIPHVDIITDPEKSPSHRGSPNNFEDYNPREHIWTIRVGDSAAAWSKSFGKLLAGKHPGCQRLIIDLTDIRGPGERLSGYGWICHGSTPYAKALTHIVEILNTAQGRALSYGELHDITNWLGTVLSTRRSAQIALFDYDGGPNTLSFMEFKDDPSRWWRGQSNNTLEYQSRPSLVELQLTLEKMAKTKRGEPGIRNLAEARRRAPWSSGTNPCAEILLPDKGFCNLVDVNLAHPSHSEARRLHDTIRLLARANYRQTLVNLQDDILQEAWHINNQNLRLCGVGLTGVTQNPHHQNPVFYRSYREVAHEGARSMAEEVGAQPPALITTVKPSGSVSKVMGCTSGVHKPLGEHMFFRINFMKDDPLLVDLREANYEIKVNPYDPDNGRLVKFPAHYPGADTTPETAIQQLERYLLFQREWADHNTSITVYYQEEEIPEIARYLHHNWDNGFVSVSFLPRTKDDGAYAYYPQEAVTSEEFNEYTAQLKPLTETTHGRLYSEEEVNKDNCEGGACPVR